MWYFGHAAASNFVNLFFCRLRATFFARLAACQLCPGVPGTQQEVENPVVGTAHETSPTSVDPRPV